MSEVGFYSQVSYTDSCFLNSLETIFYFPHFGGERYTQVDEATLRRVESGSETSSSYLIASVKVCMLVICFFITIPLLFIRTNARHSFTLAESPPSSSPASGTYGDEPPPPTQPPPSAANVEAAAEIEGFHVELMNTVSAVQESVPSQEATGEAKEERRAAAPARVERASPKTPSVRFEPAIEGWKAEILDEMMTTVGNTNMFWLLRKKARLDQLKASLNARGKMDVLQSIAYFKRTQALHKPIRYIRQNPAKWWPMNSELVSNLKARCKADTQFFALLPSFLNYMGVEVDAGTKNAREGKWDEFVEALFIAFLG